MNVESNLTRIKDLLVSAHRIAVHQEEIKNLKGENFNVFSILGMESNENKTHSAFLNELLNPQGTHLFKSLFLEYFLEVIGCHDHLEIKNTKTKTEHHIGSRNDLDKTGGRVDIYLYDSNGNSLCIENKIYAGDQGAQIERYCNHNAKKNKVYYLTLEGDNPSNHSKGSLRSEADYYCISYKETIIKWLERCMKESAEHPILRESIRQYILLLKKLTNQLTDIKMSKEIQQLIVDNYTSAKLIAANIKQAEVEIVSGFLEELKIVLRENLKEKWEITIQDLNTKWAGLTIKHIDWNDIELKLEGQSWLVWNFSIYGIRAHKDIWDRSELIAKCTTVDLLQDDFKSSEWWPYYKTLLNFGNREEFVKLLDKKD